MINFIKGCHIPNAGELNEEYLIKDNNMIVANVNAEKIMKIIYEFVDKQKEDAPLFFFLEVPSKLDDEEIIKEATEEEMGIIRNSHRDVYYMDYVPQKLIKRILDPVKDILVNDGLTTFGIGNFDTADEVGKHEYNTVMLYSKESIKEYEPILVNNGIVYNQEMISPEDLISEDNPGECSIYEGTDGKNIYDIIDRFKECFDEFYKAETRED